MEPHDATFRVLRQVNELQTALIEAKDLHRALYLKSHVRDQLRAGELENLEVWLDRAVEAPLATLQKTLDPPGDPPKLDAAMEAVTSRTIELLNEPRSQYLWSRLCVHVREVYRDKSARSSYEQVLEPYILSELSHWPDSYRQIRKNMYQKTGPELLRLGRWIELRLEDFKRSERAGLRRFFESNAFTDNYTGLKLEALGRNALDVTEALGSVRPPLLHALFVNVYSSHVDSNDALSKAFDALYSNLGPQLEDLRFGFHASGESTHADLMVRSLLEHGGRLTRLRALALDLSLRLSPDPKASALLKSPAFSKLERLGVAGMHDEEQEDFIKTLIDREANKNLRALVMSFITDEQLEVMARAPSLQAMPHWALSSDPGLLPWGHWIDLQIDLTVGRFFKAKNVRPKGWQGATLSYALLDQDQPCGSLARYALTDEELATILFEDKTRTWPKMVALDLSGNNFTLDGLKTLFEQGPQIFPNLRELSLGNSLQADHASLKMIGASKLLKQLKVLSLRWVNDFSMFVDELLDESLPTVLRQARWDQKGYYKVTDWKKLAKRLGLRGYSKLKQDALIQAVADALPSQITHEKVALRSLWSTEIYHTLEIGPEFII